MKRSLSLLILWLVAAAVFAYQPVLLRNSQYVGYDGCKVELPGSATIVFWNDTSAGTTDILAQKISQEGNVLWSAPRAIVVKPDEQRCISVINSSDGNIILLYSEYTHSNGAFSCWVQKISQAGQPLWENGGVQLIECSAYGQYPQLVTNSIGGAFAIWRDSYPSTDVLGANLDAFGTNLWTTAPLCTFSNLYYVEAMEDGAGGLLLNNRIYQSGQGYVNRVLRFDAAGDQVGSNPLLDPLALVPVDFSCIRDTQGNYILYSQHNSYMQLQKMNINGELLLPSIVQYPLPTEYNIYDIQMEACPEGKLAFAYIYQGGDNQYFINLHYLTSTLQPGWTNPLVIPCFSPSLQLDLAVGNGLWLTWLGLTYDNYTNNYTVYTTKVNNDANYAFPPVSISNLTDAKNHPVIRAFSEKAEIVWGDWTGSQNGIRTQVVTNSGSTLLETGGKNVYSVLNGSTSLEKSLSLGNNFFHIYTDTRFDFSSKLYYQITTPDCAPILENNGKALNPGSQISEYFLDSIQGPMNTILVLYSTWQDNSYKLWLQQLSSGGAPQWTGFGKLVCTSQSDFGHSKLSLSGSDILVIWEALDSGSFYTSIFGQRYSNGNPVWQESGKLLVSSGESYIYPSALQGDYVIWYEENYNTNQNPLKVLKLDVNGNPATGWQPGGIMVFAGDSYYDQYLHSGIVAGNLVVMMQKFPPEGTLDLAQMISPAGTLLWGLNGVTIASFDTWAYSYINDAIYDDGVTYVFNSENNLHYVQHLTPAGELAWGESGCPLSMDQQYYQTAKLVKFANGTYSAFYGTGSDNYQYQLCRQNINAQGEPLNQEPIIVTENNSGFWALTAVNSQNVAAITWNDSNYYDLKAKGDALPLNSLWTCRANQENVSTEDEVQNPVVYALSNYPNPFNPSTTINYSLKEASSVRVDIYNLKGQQVRHLLSETKAAGDNHLIWDGTDDQGRSVASGVYLYKIHAGKYSSSKKMMLLK